MMEEIIRTNQGYIRTKTLLTVGERNQVAKFNSNKICNSCLEYWLLKRDFIITENSITKNHSKMNIIHVEKDDIFKTISSDEDEIIKQLNKNHYYNEEPIDQMM